MNDLLQKAIALHRIAHLDEAESLYRQLLAQNPAIPEKAQTAELLGLIACQRGRLEEAAHLIGEAVALAPDNAEFWLNLGEVHRRRGKIEEAITALRRAVELAPQSAFAHYNLGVALRALIDPGALAAFRRAIDLAPDMPEAWNALGLMLVASASDAGNAALAVEAVVCYERLRVLKPGNAEVERNLGRALWEANRHSDALTAFEGAVALRNDFTAAHLSLATALRNLGHRAESLAAFRRAEILEPVSPHIQFELGITLLEMGRLEEAEIYCRRAITAVPTFAEAHRSLGMVLAARGRRSEACAAYDEALRLKEVDGSATDNWRFEHAALRGEARQSAPEAYIRGFFNAYAPRFDAELVGELNYHVPGDLVALVRETTGRLGSIHGWNVMDLGCGTGLCGVAAEPFARHLVGIDLAPKMVEAARARGIYDEVIQGDITTVLRQQAYAGAFDIIFAADVFIHVGDLREVFSAAHIALRHAGVLAFSLENHNGEGFELQECARFAHCLSYMRAEITRANLQEVVVRESVIRSNAASGWLVVVRKKEAEPFRK